MHYGTINRIDLARGFGFIREDQRDGRKDIFFHCSELRGLKFNDHLIELRVKYSRATSKKGFVALNIFESDEEPAAAPTKDSKFEASQGRCSS
jgi:cold shock CspA family protein